MDTANGGRSGSGGRPFAVSYGRRRGQLHVLLAGGNMSSSSRGKNYARARFLSYRPVQQLYEMGEIKCRENAAFSRIGAVTNNPTTCGPLATSSWLPMRGVVHRTYPAASVSNFR